MQQPRAAPGPEATMANDRPGVPEPKRALDANGRGAPSDRSLLLRFQGGQGDAATELYLRYAERLHALVKAQRGDDLAVRVDPDDVIQSVFRTFFRRAAEGQYEVPEGDDLWKLFLVIALYKVRDVAAYHRAEKRDVRRTASGAELDHAAPTDGRDETAVAALRMVIDEILARLPGSHRQIVELRIEGHDVAEIARRAGRAKRSVERILQEFRERLSAEIRDER
ncbi:MAG: sigma-70 family RNA polymerase sigma factor [Gemmataceae bacterium]